MLNFCIKYTQMKKVQYYKLCTVMVGVNNQNSGKDNEQWFLSVK